ncbi:MAG: hypothetical protein ACKO8Q_06070, partial [Bacteroidota bacterium]
LYLTSYKQEHTTQYFLLNRFKLLKQFVFPNHIDNIPGPAIQHMNVLQKSVKAYAWLGMWTLNILAFVVVFLTYKYNKLWFVLSLGNVTLVIVLAIFFGWIELRYWLPVHSLTIMLFILSTGKLNFSKSETNTL